MNKKIFARAIPPQEIIKEHSEKFKGMNIFYRGINSCLFRFKVNKTSGPAMGVLMQFSVNLHRNVVFVHKSRVMDMLDALTEAGLDNFMIAEPDETFWN